MGLTTAFSGADETNGNTGLWLFLFSEIICLVGLLLLFSRLSGKFPADFYFCPLTLELGLGAAGLVSLVSAGLSAGPALNRLTAGDKRASTAWAVVALALGALFLVGLGRQWLILFSTGLYPGGEILAERPAGEQVFYTAYLWATGIFALLALVGLAMLVRALNGKDRLNRLYAAALYWHTQALTGLFLFYLFVLGQWPGRVPVLFLLGMAGLIYFFLMRAKVRDQVFQVLLTLALLLLAATALFTLSRPGTAPLAGSLSRFLGMVPVLLFVMLFIHRVYLEVVLGFAALSLFRSKMLPNPAPAWAWPVLGVMPAIVLLSLYRRLLPGDTAAPALLSGWRLVLVLALACLALALFFRQGDKRVGLPGFLLLLVYTFGLIQVLARPLFPGQTFFITPFIHFVGFLLLSLIVTGGAIGLVDNTLKKTGYIMILMGALAFPPVISWDLYTLPGYALSWPLFGLLALILAVLVSICGLALSLLSGKEKPWPAQVLPVLILVLFGLVVAGGRTLQANAGTEDLVLLKDRALKEWAEIKAKHQESYRGGGGVDLALGEQLFKTHCSACHSLTQKILGPPLDRVLPKYGGNREALAAFIGNPKRVDPAYPAMPNPGLTSLQARSVAAFLVNRPGGEKGP